MLKDNFIPSTHAFDIIVDAGGEGDYTDIQSAINAASNGDAIFIRNGVYVITSNIAANKKLSLWGASREGAIIRIGANNIDGIVVTANGSEIHNLQVDGNVANFTGMPEGGIHLNAATDCLVDNCYVHDCDDPGIRVHPSSHNAIITNNVANSNDSYGIYVRESNDCIITNNHLESNRSGMYIRITSNSVINGNIVISALVSSGIYLRQSNDCTIIGNTCNTNNDNGIQLAYSNGNVITGNTCKSNGENGINVSTGTNTNNTITGNVCCSNTYNGIEVSAHDDDNTITGNICCSNDQCGITVFDNDNNTIIGNICNSNVWHGIWVASYMGVSGNNTIVANVCKDNDVNNTTAYDGICIDQQSSNILIVSNRCQDNDRYEINIAHAASTQNAVYGNHVRGTDHVGTINDAGTNTVIKDNEGYNPVGTSAIAVGATPFTYTAGASPESVYVSGGNVTSITKNGNNFGLTSGLFELEPWDSIVVTYIAAPTMWRDIH